nr:trypsin epsilon-like [Onthophagus taurus]
MEKPKKDNTKAKQSKGDKSFKIIPLLDVVNANIQNFGIFQENLSIAEMILNNHALFYQLKEIQVRATATIRENRTAKYPLIARIIDLIAKTKYCCKGTNEIEDDDPDLQSNQENVEEELSFRIIEGVNVELELFEFLASILHKEKHVCGGSIISHFIILTAGHCCFSRDKERLPENLKISVGSKYWADGQRYQVIKKYLHPFYERNTNVNDIALLRLKEKIIFTKGVGWVKIHPLKVLDDRINITATVIGWGYTNDEKLLVNKASLVLESVEIFSVPYDECKKYYKNLKTTNICMTGYKMRGSCTGDSGGPLVSTETRKVMQIGLVSYGGNCNNSVPEVYTRISAFYEWIKDTMRISKIEFSKENKLKYFIDFIYDFL